MNQQQKNLAELNKLVITIVIVITIAATFGNTIGVFKGEKSIPVTIAFLVLGITTSVFSIIQYKRNPISERIKYESCIGFLLMYLFTVLTANRAIVFIYLIPICYVITMYYDIKFTKIMAYSFIGLSFLFIGCLVGIHKMTESNDIMNYVVQSIATIVVAITSILTCKLTDKFNRSNIKQVMEVNEKQKEILQAVLAIGGILDSRSQEVYSIVKELQDSGKTMNETMDAMTDGMNKTSTSIDNQIVFTKDIQKIIADTSTQAKEMNEISKQSIEEIKEGVGIVNTLTQDAKIMNEREQQVSEAMAVLTGRTTEISYITDSINSIAKRINILSLNASIESARAGDAGKSFAVVASEIGKLAAQTAQSIADITAIIEELKITVGQVNHAMSQLGDVSTNQGNMIQAAESIFHKINENMSQVTTMVSDVNDQVSYIYEANDKVMKNIEVIENESKQSKQNIETTTAATNSNIEQVEQAKKVADELLSASKRLKNYI